ncbi:hypothetical protein Tco_1342662 [Tanacetum coccineum]
MLHHLVGDTKLFSVVRLHVYAAMIFCAGVEPFDWAFGEGNFSENKAVVVVSLGYKKLELLVEDSSAKGMEKATSKACDFVGQVDIRIFVLEDGLKCVPKGGQFERGTTCYQHVRSSLEALDCS